MRVIGLNSGTSADGIDAALTAIDGQGYGVEVTMVGGRTVPYPAPLRQQILQLCAGHSLSVQALAELDDAIAKVFAQAANGLIEQHGAVDLIASHGQTVFHRPPVARQGEPFYLGYSLQLGRGDLIAALTGCATVSNFRQADIAARGEGAPLVPPVDRALLSHPHRWRCVQNLGGIGNVAVLPPWVPASDSPPASLWGWDTGPGNSLIDLAVVHFSQGTKTYDKNGAWAAQGHPCPSLVEQWLQHPYFDQPPPKSTGRELFGPVFLQQCLADASALDLSPADILATLTDLTAISIVRSYQQFAPRMPDEVLLCGGGSYNAYLRQRLQQQLPDTPLQTTAAAGVPVDLKEAIAFAVLGYWRQQGFPGNLPEVTGAVRPTLLGDYYPASVLRRVIN